MIAENLKTEFKMSCVNCGSNSWEPVDQYRLKPSGMHICTCCGMVSYPEKWANYEDIKKHYQKSYRKPPNSNNLFTGQRKLYFHQSFLGEYLAELKKLSSLSIFEVGAAYGLVLDWLRKELPQAKVNGTEWTTSYKRVAKNVLNIDLVDDFDDKKHDLIISYKVAEHQLDVDKELRRYALSLTENGRLYISVPTWFDSASNFGLSGFDLEYYYDTNHINCWTRSIFENMLSRAGLEVIKKDYMIYDSTYLCKRNDSLMTTPVLKENTEDIKDRMSRLKKAFELFSQNKYDEAIKEYPDYPTAWISRLEFLRKSNHLNGWAHTKKEIETMIKACPTSVDCIVTAGDFAARFEQWNDAIYYGELGLKCKPENPVSLHSLANIMAQIAIRAEDKKAKVHYFNQALDIARHLLNTSTQHFREATDMIYAFAAQIPIDSESNN